MTSLSKLQNLQNKNIVVIGGSGYLGRAACEVCAELGGNLIVASRNKDNCEETAKNLVKDLGQNHIGIDCDITCKKSVEKFYAIIKDKYKKIDVLIISAWNGKKNTWDSIKQDDWDTEMDVCLNSIFRIIKQLQDVLRSQQK